MFFCIFRILVWSHHTVSESDCKQTRPDEQEEGTAHVLHTFMRRFLHCTQPVRVFLCVIIFGPVNSACSNSLIRGPQSWDWQRANCRNSHGERGSESTWLGERVRSVRGGTDGSGLAVSSLFFEIRSRVTRSARIFELSYPPMATTVCIPILLYR